MATITRPGKEGNATTYQGKVAAGYTKILAQEVDADIDAIYSAWNQGADTVNIKDQAVTGPKLAPGSVGSSQIADGAITQSKLGPGVNATGPAGGDLGGVYPTPSVVKVASGFLQMIPRASLNANASYAEMQANAPSHPNYDSTKPTWFARLDYTADEWSLWRSPDGSTGWVRIATATGAGKLVATLADLSVLRGQLAVNGIWGGISVGFPPASFTLTTVGSWQPYVTLAPALTTRGGNVLLNWEANLSVSAPPGGSVVYMRWLRDATQVLVRSFTVNGTAYVPLPGLSGLDVNVPAGTHTYSTQLWMNAANTFITSSGVADGAISAVELG